VQRFLDGPGDRHCLGRGPSAHFDGPSDDGRSRFNLRIRHGRADRLVLGQFVAHGLLRGLDVDKRLLGIDRLVLGQFVAHGLLRGLDVAKRLLGIG
jgi:hypothetical protein